MKSHKYTRRRKSPGALLRERRERDDSLCCRNAAKGIISKSQAKSHKGALLACRDSERHSGGANVYSLQHKGFVHARSWILKD